MKKFVDAVIKSALLFMATAVRYALFKKEEWLTMSIIVAISWATGEVAPLWYNKCGAEKSSLLKTILAIIVFVVVAFTAGVVLKNYEMWWKYSTTATATFVAATFLVPMWQDQK